MSESDRKKELTALAEQAASGDRDAINRIMKEYTGEMYFVTRLFIGDRETARSCVQASMRTILEKMKEGAESGDLVKWMRTLTAKEALHLNLPVYAGEEDGAYSGEDETIDPNASVPYDPEDIRVGVLHVMDTLPASERSAAALHFYAHKTVEETAKELSLSEADTKILLHKAKMDIRKEMPLGTFIANLEQLNPAGIKPKPAEPAVKAAEPVIENRSKTMTNQPKRKINVLRLALVIIVGILILMGLFLLLKGLFSGGNKPAETPAAEVTPTPDSSETADPSKTPDTAVSPSPEAAVTPSPSPEASASPDAAVTPSPSPEATATPGTEGHHVSRTGTLTINAGNLRVRSEPTTSNDKNILRIAEKGKTYTVTETKKTEGFTWYKIGENEWVADNGNGWVTFREDR